MSRCAVSIEQAGANDSAFVPDLPGCAATSATRPEVERRLCEAIELHLEGLCAEGGPTRADEQRHHGEDRRILLKAPLAGSTGSTAWST